MRRANQAHRSGHKGNGHADHGRRGRRPKEDGCGRALQLSLELAAKTAFKLQSPFVVSDASEMCLASPSPIRARR